MARITDPETGDCLVASFTILVSRARLANLFGEQQVAKNENEPSAKQIEDAVRRSRSEESEDEAAIAELLALAI